MIAPIVRDLRFEDEPAWRRLFAAYRAFYRLDADDVVLDTVWSWIGNPDQTADFARNPHAREFGRYGVLQVRHGRANKGSPPKRRSVLTVFDWCVDVIRD